MDRMTDAVAMWTSRGDGRQFTFGGQTMPWKPMTIAEMREQMARDDAELAGEIPNGR